MKIVVVLLILGLFFLIFDTILDFSNSSKTKSKKFKQKQ